MAKRKALRMDELMIVNPSRPHSGAYFLGEDGTLYHVQGLDLGQATPPARSFFRGEDGCLYQGRRRIRESPTAIGEVSRHDLGETRQRERGRFFLGADGTLYEVVK
jgi:hypothetical protein